jgi:hypothetical protein
LRFCGLVLGVSCQQRLRSIHEHLKQNAHKVFLILNVLEHLINDLALDAPVPCNESTVEQGTGVGQQIGHLGVLANLKACAFGGFHAVTGEGQLISVLTIGGMKVDNLSSHNKCSPL